MSDWEERALAADEEQAERARETDPQKQAAMIPPLISLVKYDSPVLVSTTKDKGKEKENTKEDNDGKDEEKR